MNTFNEKTTTKKIYYIMEECIVSGNLKDYKISAIENIKIYGRNAFNEDSIALFGLEVALRQTSEVLNYGWILKQIMRFMSNG